MTGMDALQAAQSPIFSIVADFLERCRFRDAAAAVRAQRTDSMLTTAELKNNFRELVESSSLLLQELEAGQSAAHAQNAQDGVLELLVDSLMRKLVGAGCSLSDEKLCNSIDVILGSDAFKNIGIVDIDQTDPFKQFRATSYDSGRHGAPQLEAGEFGLPGILGEVGQTDVLVDPALFQATGPKELSSHYPPKRLRGSPDPDQEWDIGDEYHDDDDPGYRIREIYEAELLAELSQKVAAEPVSDELCGAVSVSQSDEGVVLPDDVQASFEKKNGWPGGGTEASGTLDRMVDAAEEEARVPNAATSSTRARRQPANPPTFGTTSLPAEAEARTAEEKAEERLKHRRTVKYAPSGDPFYPTEHDGVVYDSFALRVVFERDKTGFEECKEFPIRTGTIVAARYQIVEYLGSAAFSRAVQCLDLERNRMVCMKIIKNDKDFLDQSLDEIKLLKYININGDVDANCVLHLYDYFYHKEHLIIVTELLRDNLYEYSKFNKESGDLPYFTLGRLQLISKQVLTALEYIHSLRLMHCDLKPENILIRSYSRCQVKVIDFGSSCFVDDQLSSYVQSRSYRAPEVMLGLPYDQKIDLWSLGCIIAELWTGYVLFQNDSVQSLLARIIGIVGEFPFHLMTSGRHVPQYFTQDGQLYQEIDSPPCPERGRRLHLLVPKKTSLRQRLRTDCDEFLDFLEQLLQLDATKRPTAKEALNHPFLASCRFPDGIPR